MKPFLPSWFKLGFAVSALNLTGSCVLVFGPSHRGWGLFAPERDGDAGEQHGSV